MNLETKEIKVNEANLSLQAATLLSSLRSNVESGYGPDGFGTIYLDNSRPEGVSKHTFAGLLSALEGAGLYRPCTEPEYRGFWGEVKQEE